MSRYSLSNTSTSSNDMLSAPKPQRVPSPNLLADDPITRLHDGIDEYPSDEIDTYTPAFHTNSSTRDHSRTSSIASTSSTCMHYVISDEFDEDPTLSSSSSMSVTHTPSLSVKRPSNSINRSRHPSRSSWISVHLNTAIQTAVKRNSTRHEQVPIPIHSKRSSVDASASAEIRSIIFARCDDDEEDSFATTASGIACSPPMRTHNPLIRDTLFQTKPTPTFTGATSIGSPSLTSIGSPRLPYSLAQALSKSNKGHMEKSDNHDIISPTNGASTNGGRTIFQFSPSSSSSQPGIAAN